MRGRAAGLGRPGSAAALVAAFALLTVAWVFAQPPFDAPDEVHHYIRAIGVADGVAVGWLLGDTAWDPPGGWAPWLALAAAGAAALALVPATARFARRVELRQ